MFHSITFGDKDTFNDEKNTNKNTWDDWHLIPTSRPVFNPPSQKTQLVDIPGANGQLDLSCVLTGYPIFQNRTGSIEFAVANGFKPWDAIYSEISNYIHGQTKVAVLEDDQGYWYEGRFVVNSWKSDKYYSTITIDYDVYPYKKERFSTAEDWLWDPFDFETGYIRENLNKVEVDSTNDYVYFYREGIDGDILKWCEAGDFAMYTIKGISEHIIPSIDVRPRKVITDSGDGITVYDYNNSSYPKKFDGGFGESITDSNVIECYCSNGVFYADSAHTTEIEGETDKMYVDLSHGGITYCWTGSEYDVLEYDYSYTPYMIVTLINDTNNEMKDHVLYGSGSVLLPELELGEGDNILVFRGKGVVTIDYRGGSL